MGLIPKVEGDYRCIILVEVWKVLTVIINIRLTTSINFHNVIHDLQAGCGTGTASLKAKILQQLTEMREEVLYTIFIYLNKVYVALDRSI